MPNQTHRAPPRYKIPGFFSILLGVNLIYAAFYQLATKESFFAGLAQDVVKERIEIDFVDFRCPALANWDRPTLLAYLVQAGLAEAVFFASTGSSVPPTEVLYKKPLCSRRGTSVTWTPLTGRFMLKCWRQEFRNFARNWGNPAPHRLASLPSPRLRLGPKLQRLKFPTCCVVLVHFSRKVATCSYFANVSSTP